MRLLSVGPLPPTPSGVADYTADLLPHLAARSEVVVAVPDDAPQPSVPFPALRISELTPVMRRAFGLPVYHLGNHRFHAEPLRLSLEWPGLVVLHDATLHHLYADVLLSRGRPAAYLREVAFDGDSDALACARAAADARAQPAWYEHPMLGRVVRTARGVLVHSRQALAAVRRADPRADVRLGHLGVDAPPPGTEVERIGHEARGRLDIADGAFLVGTFGALTEEKRLASIVAGFARLLRDRPDARLILAGEVAPNVSLGELIARHGPGRAAIVTGRLPFVELEAAMAACDVVVQLRWPTAGEASAATLRALRLGRPTIVADCGWFVDLPADAAARVPAGQPIEAEATSLAAELARLAGDPAAGARLSAGALEYVRRCDWAGAAEGYVDFARELVATGNPARPGQFLAS